MLAALTIACVVDLFAVPLAGAQLRRPFSSLKRPSHTAPLALFPLVPVWTLDLNNALTAPPAYDGERAYFAIEDDRLVAYRILDGSQLWIVDTPVRSPLVAGDDLVFVAGEDSLSARHAADGTPAWELPFADALAAPLVWDNGWLVASIASGAVVAIRANDGVVLWTHDLGSPAHAPPALDGDRVYVPLADGRLVALRLQTGEPQWEHRFGGASSHVLPLGDRLFVGSTDNFFYCLSAADGVEAWHWRTGADVLGMPVVDERTVYFVSLDNVLRGLNRGNGVQRWKRALPFRPTSGPIKAVDSLVVTGQTPSLRAFRTSDGTAAGDFSLSGDLVAPPHLFIGSSTSRPWLITVTSEIAKGATVTVLTRGVEPSVSPIGPLTPTGPGSAAAPPIR